MEIKTAYDQLEKTLRESSPIWHLREALETILAHRAAMSSAPSPVAPVVDAAIAHRCNLVHACCGTEHDPANGKLHGYCVVCGVPWPCDTAKSFLSTLPAPAPVADDDGLIYGIHGGNVSPVAGVGETCPHCVTCGTLMIVSKEFVGVSVCPRCHGSGQAPGKGADNG